MTPARACLVFLIATLAIGAAPRHAALPRLVFVARRPTSERGQIPGFGPRGRALAPGGRLMVREPDGRLHALLAPGALFDASDPSVSWNGRRIVFAAVPAPGRDWRLYTVEADGRGLRALTAD